MLRRRRPFSSLRTGAFVIALLLTLYSVLVDHRPIAGPGSGADRAEYGIR